DEVKRLPAGHCVPDFDVRTVATGNNPPTVGTDREAPDFVAVPVEGDHFLALVPSERGRVPDADGAVMADRGKAPTVRAERRAPAHVLVPVEAEHLAGFLAFAQARHVPDVDCLVFAGRDEATAVRTEGDRQDVP